MVILATQVLFQRTGVSPLNLSGWVISSPEEQGLASENLTSMIEYINTYYPNIYSVVIIRNGYLIKEEYFQPDIKRNIHSCTKSIVSALIGIAINEGFISGVEAPVIDFFQNKTFTNLDERKQNMTLYHLLTMTTGLEWFELSVGYDDPDNTLFDMWESSDWVQYVLDKPMIEEPGKLFNYNTGVSHILSAILTQTTGMSTYDFAMEYLFGPLNIVESDVNWPKGPKGIYIGGDGLMLTSRTLAKIGQLYLSNGSWNGLQVVPSEWVVVSTINHRPPGDYSYGYGYQWWIHPEEGIFSAWGYAHQRIVVVPNHQLVVVFTSNMPNIPGDPASVLIHSFIVPAIFPVNEIPTTETETITNSNFTLITSTVTNTESSETETISTTFMISSIVLLIVLKKMQKILKLK
jgi:CubicO group peptidase (beta-lactamase class C family)